MALDEAAFLAALLPQLQGGARDAILPVRLPPGDDCAALDLGQGDYLLLAVDQIAAEVHFHGPLSSTPTPPALVGRKLLARNLSDIAAMGGTPRHALLALAVPHTWPDAWVPAFMEGLLALAAEYQVRLIGGDYGRAQAFVASLTITGTVPAAQLCRRDAAVAGDELWVTGSLGESLASGVHLSFTPRLAEGHWLAANAYTHCLMDLSDGLLVDLPRLCAASGLAASLDLAAIPRRLHEGHLASLAAALTDGEDYELLITVPPNRAAEMRRHWPFATPLHRVGSLHAPAPTRPLICDAADGGDLLARFPGTFRHFNASPEAHP